MASLYGKIGQNDPAYLLADPIGAEKIGVSLKPGVGTIKRGTVIYRNSSNLYEAAAAANIIATNYLAVLDEEVTSATGETIAPVASAYRKGNLIAGKVIISTGTAVTAAQEVILRGQGIVLSQMDATAPELNNEVTPNQDAGGGT